jgi:hypothetical protein
VQVHASRDTGTGGSKSACCTSETADCTNVICTTLCR